MNIFENNYEAPEWDQLSEEEKKLFQIEEEKTEKKLLRIPVYSKAVDIFHLVESIVASLQEDEEAEPLLDFFTQNAFSIRLNIRGCVFTGNWFCHMRNAALIRDCAEALYITSNPENEI